MKLYLMRHGDYVDASVNPEKPLSPKGMETVKKVGQFFKNYGVKVDIIFHSTKKRAQQTAQIVRNLINEEAHIEPKDYLSPNDATENIIYDISSLDEDTLIVGHLPFLPTLVADLTCQGIQESPVQKMPAGSVVVLERDEDQRWNIVSVVMPDTLEM